MIINALIALAAAGMVIAVALAVSYTIEKRKLGEESGFSNLIDYSEDNELAEKIQTKEGALEKWSNYWDSQALKSGIYLPAGDMGRNVVIISVVVFIALALIVPNGVLLGFVAALVAPLLIKGVLSNLQKKRDKKLSDQIPYFIGQMRTVTAANATPKDAILAVVDDIPAPLGTELRLLRDDLNVGMTLKDSLRRMTARIPVRELRFLNASIEIASQSGSDLEPQLVSINEIVDARRTLAQKLAAAVASVSTSFYVSLFAIPVFFIFTFLSNDNAAGFWFSLEGLPYLAIVLVLYITGIVLTRFIINKTAKF